MTFSSLIHVTTNHPQNSLWENCLFRRSVECKMKGSWGWFISAKNVHRVTQGVCRRGMNSRREGKVVYFLCQGERLYYAPQLLHEKIPANLYTWRGSTSLLGSEFYSSPSKKKRKNSLSHDNLGMKMAEMRTKLGSPTGVPQDLAPLDKRTPLFLSKRINCSF